jgi:flagellar motility protein MotE (MotC chaperone)
MTRARVAFAQADLTAEAMAHMETRRVLTTTQEALDMSTANLRATNEELERFRQRHLDALRETLQQAREAMQHLDTIRVLQARLQATEAELQLTREARDDAQAFVILNWL